MVEVSKEYIISGTEDFESIKVFGNAAVEWYRIEQEEDLIACNKEQLVALIDVIEKLLKESEENE